MKILVVCPYVPHPPEHGGRIRSRLFIETAAERHDVQIAACCADDRDRADARALTAATNLVVHELPARPGARAGFATKLGCWALGRSELLRRRWGAGAAPRLASLLAEGGFGAVVADSTFALPVLPAAIDVPVIQQLPNVEYAALARPGAERSASARLSRAAEARVMRRIERRWARRARLTLVASQRDREHLLAVAPGAAVRVVENSVDLDRLPLLPPPQPTRRPLLLFVGSFEYSPNAEALRELITVHLPVLRAQTEVRVRCIGGGLGGELADLARRAGVETPGHVPDLLPHYTEAAAVYLPIRSGGGTRIKVLEALALGRPVISTAIGVEGLGLEPGLDYLPCDEPAQGARAVEQLTAAGASDRIARGRALVETRYAHAVVRTRIAALLEEWL